MANKVSRICIGLTGVLALAHLSIVYLHSNHSAPHTTYYRHTQREDQERELRHDAQRPPKIADAGPSFRSVQQTTTLRHISPSPSKLNSSFICTQPVHNIYFLKMFKSASSTIQTMIQAFALRNQLTQMNLEPQHPFPDPDFRMYIANTTAPVNILSEHTVFCEICIRQTLPGDTLSWTLIREPFSRLKSLFQYFNIHQLHDMPRPYAFEKFMKNLSIYDTKELRKMNNQRPKQRGYSFRYGKEMLATQFGYLEGHDIADMDAWLRFLDSRFALVGLVERMHESVVLARRLLCWSTKDILYVSLRQTRHVEGDALMNMSAATTEADLKRIHRNWSPIDYKLYEYFSHRLEERISMQPADFHAEVEHYRLQLESVDSFCHKLCPWINEQQRKGENCHFGANEKYLRSHELTIRESVWSKEFSIDGVDCVVMMMNHDRVRDKLTQKNTRSNALYGRVPWNTFCRPGSFLTC